MTRNGCGIEHGLQRAEFSLVSQRLLPIALLAVDF